MESDPLGNPNVKPLAGKAGKYRYRVGGLRIIYEIDLAQRVVYVMAILPRGQACK